MSLNTAEHVRASGLFGRRSYFVELLTDRLREPTLSSDSYRKLLKTELFASY